MLIETLRLPLTKNCKIPQPEGRQAKSVNHRTDHEEAGDPAEIQWLPRISPDIDQLGKTGAGVSPGGVLVTLPPRAK